MATRLRRSTRNIVLRKRLRKTYPFSFAFEIPKKHLFNWTMYLNSDYLQFYSLSTANLNRTQQQEDVNSKSYRYNAISVFMRSEIESYKHWRRHLDAVWPPRLKPLPLNKKKIYNWYRRFKNFSSTVQLPNFFYQPQLFGLW